MPHSAHKRAVQNGGLDINNLGTKELEGTLWIIESSPCEGDMVWNNSQSLALQLDTVPESLSYNNMVFGEELILLTLHDFLNGNSTIVPHASWTIVENMCAQPAHASFPQQ